MLPCGPGGSTRQLHQRKIPTKWSGFFVNYETNCCIYIDSSNENNHLRVVVVFDCGVFQFLFIFGPCTIYLLRTTPIIICNTANVNNFVAIFLSKKYYELS